MAKPRRCGSILVLTAGALALAGNSYATYAPKLLISHGSYAPGAGTSLTLDISQASGENETARTVILAPVGYILSLPPPGARVGVVRATVSLGGSTTLTLRGEVLVADSSALAGQATQCTGSPSHAAVLLLRWSIPGGSAIEVPTWIDTGDGTSSSYRIEICLPASKSLPLAAKVLGVGIDLVKGIAVSPAARGRQVWTALSTPYAPDGLTADPAGTAESRAIVVIPAALSLRRVGPTRIRVGDTIRLAGALVQEAAAGVRVTIKTGTTAARLSTTRRALVGTGGTFAVSLKAAKLGVFFVQASYGPTDVTAADCANPTPGAPVGCTSATLSPLVSPVLKITVRKRHAS